MDVRRVFVEKRPGFDLEASRLKAELADFLGVQYPALSGLGALRILHRYDVALPGGGLAEEQFKKITDLVLSEPQCDRVYPGNAPPVFPHEKNAAVFGIEYVSGQYDQRADSAEQCAELVTGVRPVVRTARIYILIPGDGPVPAAALEAVKRYLINPVDSREAAAEIPASLEDAGTEPPDVPVLEGFRDAAEPDALARRYGFAMSPEDLAFCRAYFTSEGRDPSLAELRVLDTYWSDHCRHTTFTTVLEDIAVEDGPLAPRLRNALALYEAARREVYGASAGGKPRSLMDMATIGAKVLKKRGLLADLDESEEINACSVRVRAEFADGSSEPWLLLFKNETHNHPTEIEPFGGAATCLGGAIRDPLSGRAYVYQAMRVTGGGDPRSPLSETMPGKLPQLKIAREAAAGYASYGNQIGLATGQVAEFYHPGFLAKRMELGAVIGAAPAAQVRRAEPVPGDAVILVGGKTGRDGIGGATGSSKVHTGESVEAAGAEVQKGNAVEERKLQRLFRNPRFTGLIKRCNDFGAGGVAVAVGELAPGLDIDLSAVPKKYAGLDGVELAISESQERMAVVCAPEDADAVIALASEENLDAVVIAAVTKGADAVTEGAGGPAGKPEARLRMIWRGKTIVDLSRDFLNSNGASRTAAVRIGSSFADAPPDVPDQPDAPGRPGVGKAEAGTPPPGVLLDSLKRELGALRSGSRRGLQERFDGSIGAASVLFPWGGREQGTPECGMAGLLPSPEKSCVTASLMSFGYDPALMSRNPYEGAKGSIREALAKFACLGGDPWTARLSLQEYFERAVDPVSWGKPAAALLGALEAQLRLGTAAIGGKDSMSGTYRDAAAGIGVTVPPTLVAFAAGTAPAAAVRSGALSGAPGNSVILLRQTDRPGEETSKDGWEIFKANMNALAALSSAGLVRAAYPVGPGGAAVSLALMAFGNMTGVEVTTAAFETDLRAYQGSALAEIEGEAPSELLAGASWITAARTIGEPLYRVCASPGGGACAEAPLAALRLAWERPLAQVYPQTAAGHTAAETVLETETAGPEYIRPFLKGRKKTAPANSARNPAGALPLAVLPVFPGTNCEWDMERAFRQAGVRTRQVLFRNRNQEDIAASIRELAAAVAEAQIVALSGGFSAGDEPDGSGKFIANVFRAPAVAEAVTGLLEKRDGLILGICNGFQALIKLGLVPYGAYRDARDTMPTLSFNRIGRHVSRMVRTRVMSNLSPWLSLDEPGTIHTLPVSHGEGRVVIRGEEAAALFKAGQVPFCYADARGRPALAEPDNPNGSDFAIEGLTSPDGRVLGKMAHSERRGRFVHINIPGNKDQRIFEAGAAYFR
jgi:phosphoribosylformylglycinamidine synthase